MVDKRCYYDALKNGEMEQRTCAERAGEPIWTIVTSQASLERLEIALPRLLAPP